MTDPARRREPATARRRRDPVEAKARRQAVDDPQVVLEAAARFLEVRSRSVAEVRRRLTRAGYRADLVDGAIGRLTDLGMLDDEAFARSWVESRDRARPRGERAIREELRMKGVDRQTIDAVLDERRAADGEAELGPDRVAAERLIAKHARALARVADPRQRRQRAYALLARNGFDPATCREVATSAAAAHPADADEGPPDP